MTQPAARHLGEPHHSSLAGRLNWLRAGVLGANDGIVSIAGLVVGVAGASTGTTALLAAGIAGLVAGAFSMAGGEYVSVSAQRDTERAMIRLEKHELTHMPEEELAELTQIYRDKGLSEELASQVAVELTAKDALRAHAEAELGIELGNYVNPWQAAGASFAAFTIGGLLPLVAIMLPPTDWQVWTCGIAVVAALALTGFTSARLGGARVVRAVLRNVGMGVATMVVTYLVGLAFGVTLN